MKDAARHLGIRGEQIALSWYLARDYQLVDRNWRCKDGELDLVLSKDNLYVFCEVKTRSSAGYGLPIEAITPSKLAKWRKAAAQWLSTRTDARPRKVRFDVAAVKPGGIEVIEDIL